MTPTVLIKCVSKLALNFSTIWSTTYSQAHFKNDSYFDQKIPKISYQFFTNKQIQRFHNIWFKNSYFTLFFYPLTTFLLRVLTY